MELRQLTYFEAVARHGSFTRAAEELRIAQPAVSAQIRRLEDELGAGLLQRTTRRVALTEAGELLLGRVRRVQGELAAARTDLADLADVLRGRVRVGATLVLGPLDLPAALASFRGRYPGVTLALRSGLIAELLGALDGGEVDIVLGPAYPDLPDRFVARPRMAERVVLIAPPRSSLAAQVSFADLRDRPFVSLTTGSGLRTILDDAGRRAGFTPRVDFETHSPASIRELVSAGLGVALLADSAARAPGAPVEIHRVVPEPPYPPIALIRRRGYTLAPAARAFARALAETMTASYRAEQPSLRGS
jgi:LysR family transcriptional activator of glutamate synthase operon